MTTLGRHPWVGDPQTIAEERPGGVNTSTVGPAGGQIQESFYVPLKRS